MCLHISFVVFLCGPLSMYARANGIHEIDILCWFQVHIHQPKKILVLFQLCNFRPKLSPCVLHHAHTFCDECVYRFLWPVPQSIDKQYNWILCLHHKTPSQTSLRYAWIYHLSKWFLLFPPVHLSSWRCIVKFSFRANICQQPLHSHCLQSTSIFLM